ncbi:DoxX family protein [Halorarum halobium]|uniref:DoxX family protein n=1 Tax=Halorarum halobium TaxID=3075121 RepID=UPI0028B0C0A0|nr:DoxX family protein [Halobaculum sp. XH14]
MDATVILQGGTVFDGPGAAEAFLVGRLLFGLVLAFNGLNHFQNVDALTGYAEAKGLPAPRFGVLFSGGMLLFGGLGIAAGALVPWAAGAIVLFALAAAFVFHDFWAVPEEQTQDEMTHFLKNMTILGGALVFLALSSVQWPYSLGI